MIREHGVLAGAYSASGSVKEAIEAARTAQSVAWLAASDASEDDFEQLAQALSVDVGGLALIRRQRNAQRIDRSRVVLFPAASVLDVVLLDFTRPSTEPAGNRGRLELLTGEHVVVVLSYGWYEPVEAIREAITDTAATAQASIGMLELIIGRTFDRYDELLDDVEDAVEEVTEDVLTRRDPAQLSRIIDLSRPAHAAVISVQPFVHGLDDLRASHHQDQLTGFSRRVHGHAAYLLTRTERLLSALDSLQQTYFSLSQDEANRIAADQSEITKRLSGWALLLAVPTIFFSLYGTNFQNIKLIQTDWGYPVMLGLTVVLCLFIYWRLRRSGWL